MTQFHKCKLEAALLKSVVPGQSKIGARIRGMQARIKQKVHLNNVKVAAFCLTVFLPQRIIQDICQRFLFLPFIWMSK